MNWATICRNWLYIKRAISSNLAFLSFIKSKISPLQTTADKSRTALHVLFLQPRCLHKNCSNKSGFWVEHRRPTKENKREFFPNGWFSVQLQNPWPSKEEKERDKKQVAPSAPQTKKKHIKTSGWKINKNRKYGEKERAKQVFFVHSNPDCGALGLRKGDRQRISSTFSRCGGGTPHIRQGHVGLAWFQRAFHGSARLTSIVKSSTSIRKSSTSIWFDLIWPKNSIQAGKKVHTGNKGTNNTRQKQDAADFAA